jgi:hypothetical protein
MARWSSLKSVLLTPVRSWRLWLLQFLGNVVIFLGFLWWLRTPDAHWWQLLLQVVLVVLIVVAASVLQGGTLNYFKSTQQGSVAQLTPAFRSAFRHVAAFFLWAVVFFYLWNLIGRLHDYDTRFPGYLRSEFPAWLRNIVSEPTLDNLYSTFVSFLRWVVLPALLLPFALFTADRGFRGLIAFRDWRGKLRSLGYWLTLVVAAILGVYCVTKIAYWTLDPKTATLAAEKTSLAFRLLFAYLLALFSWLLTCSVLGRARSVGEPAAQPK